MKLPEATRDALKKYLSGEAHHPAMTPTTRRMLDVFLFADENHDELEALRIAEEHADFEPLAELIETAGELRTPDARTLVAALLRGNKRKPGNKRTEENMLRRIRLFMEVQYHMHTFGESQAKALRRAIETRQSFVEKAFEVHQRAHGGKEPVGETSDFLEKLSNEAVSGLRGDFKKGRAELREVLKSLGFVVGPAFQVNSKGGDAE